MKTYLLPGFLAISGVLQLTLGMWLIAEGNDHSQIPAEVPKSIPATITEPVPICTPKTSTSEESILQQPADQPIGKETRLSRQEESCSCANTAEWSTVGLVFTTLPARVPALSSPTCAAVSNAGYFQGLGSATSPRRVSGYL